MTIKKTTPDNGSPPKKKPARKTLSPRQQKVIEILQDWMSENVGKLTKWKVLEQAWYPKSIQNTPDKVFASLSMKRALKKVWMDAASLKRKHTELLNSSQISQLQTLMSVPAAEFIQVVVDNCPWSKYLSHYDIPMAWQRVYVFLMPDKITQARVLELAYKVTGWMAPEKHEVKFEAPVLYLPDNNRTLWEVQKPEKKKRKKDQ
jgi:hypothetical protein